MSNEHNSLTIGLSVAIVVVFTVFAFTMLVVKKQSFIALPASHHWFIVGWSLFASNLGAWTITLPPHFAATQGWPACISYALVSALSLPFITCIAIYYKKYSSFSFTSLSQLVRHRFGIVAQIFVTILSFIYISFFIIGEHNTLASIFKDAVGIEFANEAVLVISICISVYTTWGGFGISMITDTLQGISAVVLILIISGIMAFSFRLPKLSIIPNVPNEPTVSEHVKFFFTLMFAIFPSAFFYEAIWQRVWAAKSRKDVILSTFTSSLLLFVIIFILSMCGHLASVANRMKLGNLLVPDNTALFDVFKHIDATWPKITVVLLSIVMYMGAMDSLMSGMISTIIDFGNTISYSETRIILITRIIVFVLNLLYAITARLSIPVMNLSLLVNNLTVCSFSTLLIGFMDRRFKIIKRKSSIEVIVGFISTCTAVTVYAIIFREGSVLNSIVYCWWGHEYNEIAYFLVAIGTSLTSLCICRLINCFI